MHRPQAARQLHCRPGSAQRVWIYQESPADACSAEITDMPDEHGRSAAVALQAFTTWQSHTTHKLQQQEKLRQAVTRLQHCLVARALSTWGSHTRRSGDLRQRLARAVSAFQNSAARAAFNAWLENTQQMRESRAQVPCRHAHHLLHARFARVMS